MAFNPFTTFQKNKRFWMGAMTLVAMLTFVIFTGQGDITERFLRWFGRRGTPVVRVANTGLTSYDLTRLRDERLMVNEFMHQAAQFAIGNVNKFMQKIQESPVPTDKKKD